MFIGSSVERLNLAYAVQQILEYDVEATVWNQNIFLPSRTTMDALSKELNRTDFALFIFAPDDTVRIRDIDKSAVRDNVILELGLFIGRLGVERCFVIVPRGTQDLRLPTDLFGLTAATFDPEREDGNFTAALGPACNNVRQVVAEMGRVGAVEQYPATSDVLCDDPGDCLALLESWLGNRSSAENLVAMRYEEIDRELKLVPGCARLYLEQAASNRRYIAANKGKYYIRFEEIQI